MSRGKVSGQLQNTGRFPRQRKAHRKSKAGCTNCRFRRVKCGEEQPQCRQCKSYMVPCSYNGSAADLQSLEEKVATDFTFLSSDTPPSRAIAINTPSITESPLLLLSSDPQHATIIRFKQRTALTFGTSHTAHLYGERVPRLAMQYEFLRHAVIATTFIHDRSLAGVADPLPQEAYHLGQSAALLNKKLSTRISDPDRDAIWATAIYILAMSIFSVNTTDPKKAWPMNPHKFKNLEWVDLQAGLRVIWEIATMDKHGIVFAHVQDKAGIHCVHPATPQPSIEHIAPLLVKLCGLHHDSPIESNPYHTAAWHLSSMLTMESTPANTLKFMDFIAGVTVDYKALLESKDPRALLLLSLWYSKMWHCTWWVVPRAVVECRSICEYLSQQKIDDDYFRAVLKLLRKACANLDSSITSSLLSQPPEKLLQKRKQDGPTSIQMGITWA